MTLIIPFTLVCIAVSSAEGVTHKNTGDSIVLQAGNKPEKLNSIVWMHGGNRAAEWYEGDPDVSYYRIFHGSSVLDMSTCSLTIKNLDKRFNGIYTAEINGQNPTKSETLEVLAEGVTYKKTGDSIVLQPENKPEKLNSVVWKHNEDRAAEWYEGDPDVSYYRIFHGSSVLDMSTCSLTIKNLDKPFNGIYTVEINAQNPTKSETVEVLDPVSTVTISPGSNCEDGESENCTLSCNGTGDGPLMYSWTPSQTPSGHEVIVPKGGKSADYTCNVSNPVSWEAKKYSVPEKGKK